MNIPILQILLIIAVIVLIAWIKHRFKVPDVGSLAIVTGGVKCGKSTFAIHLAYTNYKRILRRWYIRSFFRKIFGIEKKKGKLEKPLFYSNIPLRIPYVPLTDNLLFRKERFTFGSVIYCGEVSLVADSRMFNDADLNERLLLFNKLIGHETHGGILVYDTHSIADCHYSLKRCVSEYFYIHHLNKWLPFFMTAEVIENRYSEDNSVVAVDTEDVELHTRKVLMSKSIWKKFDSYCYSSFTDTKPVANTVIKLSKDCSLKAENIVSFREYKHLYGDYEKDENKAKKIK